MRKQSERAIPDSLPEDARPIELVTENGFSILRLWEIDRVPPSLAGNFQFLVRSPPGPKPEIIGREIIGREITLEIADDLVVEIAIRTSQRVLSDSSYWICCAERHLANYLWESSGYPTGDKLRVKQLDPDDIISAIRWGTS